MQVRYRVNDVRTLLEAVTDDLGYARIDASNLSQPLKQMGLQQLLSDYTISTADTAIYAIYPHRKQLRLVKELIQVVKTILATRRIGCNI